MRIIRPLATCTVAVIATLFVGTVAAQAITVTCESVNYRDQVCPVSGGPVSFVRQLSTTPGDCIEGQTWGFDGNNNTIWVSRGCRAEFRVGYVDAYPHPVPAPGMTITCESVNYRDQVCPVSGGPVSFVRQLSTTPGDCIEGQTWGFDGNNNTIWVSRGCRAEFRVGYVDAYPRPVPAPGMTITCESVNYRDQECPVSGGPVAFVQQLSTPPGDCIEGQTWGYNRNNGTIWVTRGCRAEFRVGYAGGYPRPAPSPGMTITCESINYRDQDCPVSGGPVAFVRQLSATPGDCIEGQTWGFDGRNNTIWVTRGCRAEFRVGYR